MSFCLISIHLYFILKYSKLDIETASKSDIEELSEIELNIRKLNFESIDSKPSVRTVLKSKGKQKTKLASTYRSKRKKLRNSDSANQTLIFNRQSKKRKIPVFKSKVRDSEVCDSEVKRAKDYVICASGLNSKEYESFETFCVNFEIEIDDDVDNCFTTHIVVKDMKKTAKFIKAVFYKVNIVSFEWINDSMNLTPPAIQPIDKYLFRIGKSKNDKMQNKKSIFKNMNFLLSSSLKRVQSLQNLDLEYFIIALGGITHRTMRSAIQELDCDNDPKTLYIVSEGTEALKNPPNCLKPSIQMENVHYKWIIDCVCDGKVLPINKSYE